MLPERPTAVSVLVIRTTKQGEEVCLAVRKTAPGVGRLSGPGGKLEENESPRKGATRETQEETGMVIAEEQLEFLGTVGQYFALSHKCYMLAIFLCRWVRENGEPENREPDKHEPWQWYPLDSPTTLLSLATRVMIQTYITPTQPPESTYTVDRLLAEK